MSLIREIKDILKPLGVKAHYLRYEGDERTYINFYIFNERDSLYADDKEVETEYAIQISLFSDDKLRYYNLQNEFKQIMKQYRDRFIKFDVSPDLYEKDTELYHKAFRYLHYVNVE